MASDAVQIFFTFIFYTVKKTFVIFYNAFVIFCNPFHCKCKELIIFVIALLVTYDWVLRFHISSKSNKQVMSGVTSGSELLNRRNKTARKRNAI